MWLNVHVSLVNTEFSSEETLHYIKPTLTAAVHDEGQSLPYSCNQREEINANLTVNFQMINLAINLVDLHCALSNEPYEHKWCRFWLRQD